jgi:tetratricopeptide (TPR) repeat protein
MRKQGSGYSSFWRFGGFWQFVKERKMTFRYAVCAWLVTVLAAAQPPAQPTRSWNDAYRAGLSLFEQRDYERARAALLDALVDLHDRPPADWRLPATLHVLGVSEQALGRYTEARQHLEGALSGWPATGENAGQRATTLESLGNLLADTGDWDSAEQRLRSAIALKEGVYGAASLETASTVSRVAERFIARGELLGAKPLLERALDIQRQLLPAADADLLTTRIMLAHTLRGLGHLEAARRYAADAEAAGRQSRLYPEILSILGDVYRREGNSTRAVPLLRQAIALAALRTSEQELPAAVISLAYIDLTDGRLLSASEGFQRGIMMIQRSSSAGRPEVAAAQLGLAAAMLEARRVKEASVLLDSAQPFIESAFPDEHVFRAMGLILRATLAAARADRNRTAEDVRSAWAAIELEAPGATQAGLWTICARLMRPYRPDLATVAGKRSRKWAREISR